MKAKQVTMNGHELRKWLKEQGLNSDQISYAKTLMSMFGESEMSEIVKTAKQYQSMSQALK